MASAQMKIYLTDPLLTHLPARLRAGLATPAMTVLTEAAVAVTLARRVDELDEGSWVGGDTIGYIRTGPARRSTSAQSTFRQRGAGQRRCRSRGSGSTPDGVQTPR